MRGALHYDALTASLNALPAVNFTVSARGDLDLGAASTDCASRVHARAPARERTETDQLHRIAAHHGLGHRFKDSVDGLARGRFAFARRCGDQYHQFLFVHSTFRMVIMEPALHLSRRDRHTNA